MLAACGNNMGGSRPFLLLWRYGSFRIYLAEASVMARFIAFIAHHPYLNLLSGLVLLLTAGREILVTVEEGVGAHHGVAVFGALQVLKSLPELMHGVEGVTKFSENHRPQRPR